VTCILIYQIEKKNVFFLFLRLYSRETLYFYGTSGVVWIVTRYKQNRKFKLNLIFIECDHRKEGKGLEDDDDRRFLIFPRSIIKVTQKCLRLFNV